MYSRISSNFHVPLNFVPIPSNSCLPSLDKMRQNRGNRIRKTGRKECKISPIGVCMCLCMCQLSRPSISKTRCRLRTSWHACVCVCASVHTQDRVRCAGFPPLAGTIPPLHSLSIHPMSVATAVITLTNGQFLGFALRTESQIQITYGGFGNSTPFI